MYSKGWLFGYFDRNCRAQGIVRS
uniref:Uncharacterized protein n=1 Tax=Arundo donax TaxID=35708 RepID=A0A0A9AEX2_ARUDO